MICSYTCLTLKLPSFTIKINEQLVDCCTRDFSALKKSTACLSRSRRPSLLPSFFAAVLQMLRAKHAAHVLKELPLLRPGVVEYKNYFCGNMVKYHEIFFHFEFCRVSFSSFFFPLFGLLLVILLLFILFVFLLLALIAAFLLWVLQVLNAKHRAHAERFALYRS